VKNGIVIVLFFLIVGCGSTKPDSVDSQRRNAGFHAFDRNNDLLVSREEWQNALNSASSDTKTIGDVSDVKTNEGEIFTQMDIDKDSNLSVSEYCRGNEFCK
jgi:Ca2+-binding EF-hand superfamily protein